MAAVVPIAKVPAEESFCGLDPEKASPAEIVATFSHSDLVDASRETSSTFRGAVLSKALVIVQARTRCFSLLDFSERMFTSKTVMYRWVRARPTTVGCYERAMRLLTMELADRGVD